jgi:hypothetical protein
MHPHTQQSLDKMSDGNGGPPSNVGTYLARRLIQIGITEFFAVPGDYNLLLLDQLLKFPKELKVTIFLKISFENTHINSHTHTLFFPTITRTHTADFLLQ